MSSEPEPTAPSIKELAPLFPAYEIEGFIAQGGMGAVYKARQKSLDRPVAIKILPRELGGDPVFRLSFEAEAKAMARLNHPNLVGVYDFGEADGMLFIIMEYVQGNSLHRSCHGKEIDPAQAGEIVSAISRGLAHAHEHGILHRDIKPGNILIDSKAMPKIGDFGLAFPMGEQAGPEEAIYGTPGYTAPEIYLKETASPRSDLYSVGVLLAELLTGTVPAENQRPDPPSQSCGCSPEFDAIVARATQANPELRFADANELAEALDKAVEAAANNSGSANRLIMAPPPSVVPASGGAPVPSTGAVTPQKKSPALPLGIGLGAAAMVIAAIAIQANSGGEPEGQKETPEVAVPEDRGDEATRAEAKPVADPGAAAIFAGGGEETTAPDEPETEVERESPLESLAALKGKLAAGERDEFPVGTEERGDSYFLLVDKALSWGEARRFAEEHGAHLAVFAVPSDRLWFRETFSPEESLWIGAGIAAREKWQWLDGSRWLPIDTPPNLGAGQRYMTLSESGQLGPAAAGQAHHFAIQWRRDSENPATIGAELRRTAASIDSAGIDMATYPVGTRSYPQAGSHFFAVRKALSWDAARKLAQAAKGYLAVSSSAEEGDWILDQFSRASAPDAPAMMWIGGYRVKPGTPWSWLTREAWTNSSWLIEPGADDPAIKTVCLRIGEARESSGWVASTGEDGYAQGMLVEWSQPKRAAAVASFDLDTWLGGVDQTFADRVRPDLERYEKARSDEVAGYIKAMRKEGEQLESRLENMGIGRGRDRGRGGRGGWLSNLMDESLEAVEKSGEIPDSLPRFVPGEIRDIQERSKRSVEKLDKEFQERLAGHLETYTEGLSKKALAVGESGFDEAETALTERVASIGNDTEKFLDVLGLGGN